MAMTNTSDPSTEPKFNVAEAAVIIRTSEWVTRRLIRTGQLGAYRYGRGYRLSPKHIADFLAAHDTRNEGNLR